MLKTIDLRKNFGGIRAVKKCNFKINYNDVVGIVGANGAGKSTLLNLLTGIEKTDKGKIIFENKDITSYAPYKRFSIGVNRTFQKTRLFYNLDILQNLELSSADVKLSTEILKQFELLTMKRVTTEKLSIGQQRLVELTRVLATKCKLTILDEPFSGIHKKYIKYICKLIRKLKDERSFIIVDHDIDTVFSVCDRIFIMDCGTLIKEIKPKQETKTNLLKVIYGP